MDQKQSYTPTPSTGLDLNFEGEQKNGETEKRLPGTVFDHFVRFSADLISRIVLFLRIYRFPASGWFGSACKSFTV